MSKERPLAKLDTSRGSNNLTFPEDKTYQTHNITFRIFKLKRDSRDADDKRVPVATIVLPMTQELQVSYNAGYASPDLGGIVAEALKVTENAGASISGMIKKGADLKDVLDAIKKNTGAQDIATAVSGATGAALNTVAQGGEALFGNVVKAGLNAFGVARNPHKAVLFEGTDFRSHSFNFRLSPITATESDAIRQIIHIFKYHMHPGYVEGVVGGLTIGTGNHFFETPDFFNIELSHKGAYTVSDYRPCVLKGMTVNYQPSNYPAYARSEGGAGAPAPMEVVMGLEFQEIEIITKKDIGNPYYGGAINPFNYSENYG
jgi:hypothetical protein